MQKSKPNGHDIGDFTPSLAAAPAPIGPAGMYGIAGEFVKLVETHTEADRNAILLAFLAYAGNLLGRSFYVPTAADRHCGNLFLCLVGPTAGGRKGSAISTAELFFSEGEHACGLPRILYGISSGEGVIWKVHDAISRREWNKKTKTFEDLPLEEDVSDKRTLYCLSEFAQNIVAMKRPDSILSAVLRQAWDKDKISSPSKNSSATATGAHISMIGAISKEELLQQTTTGDADNGTLNRFLFAWCQRSRLLPEGETLYTVTQQPEWIDLQRRFRGNIAPEGKIHMRRTGECQTAWGLNKQPEDGGLYKRLSQLRPGLWGTVTARAAQQVIRLALITAVINGHSEIQIEDQDAAWEYWRYCDETCRHIWGDDSNPIAGRILDSLRRTAEGIPRRAMFEIFHGHVTADALETALAWLNRTGLAYSRTAAGENGRPRETWFATI